jgi:hypothetical protein
MWGTPVPFSHGPLLRGCQRSGGVGLQLLAGEMTSAQDESLGGFFREIRIVLGLYRRENQRLSIKILGFIGSG